MILSLNDVLLERVCSYTYLGFILDDHLNFNKHLNSMVSTVSHKLYLLSRIRRYLNNAACISIFKTMVLSILEYGNIIYSGTSKINLEKLDKLFHRGLKICDATNNNVSKNQLCYDCKITPLETRREVQLLIFMHKQTQNIDLLKMTKIETRLHAAPVFRTYKPNNEKALLNVMYRGAITWNALPFVDRNKKFNDFKMKIRRDKL